MQIRRSPSPPVRAGLLHGRWTGIQRPGCWQRSRREASAKMANAGSRFAGLSKECGSTCLAWMGEASEMACRGPAPPLVLVIGNSRWHWARRQQAAPRPCGCWHSQARQPSSQRRASGCAGGPVWDSPPPSSSLPLGRRFHRPALALGLACRPWSALTGLWLDAGPGAGSGEGAGGAVLVPMPELPEPDPGGQPGRLRRREI